MPHLRSGAIQASAGSERKKQPFLFQNTRGRRPSWAALEASPPRGHPQTFSFSVEGKDIFY